VSVARSRSAPDLEGCSTCSLSEELRPGLSDKGVPPSLRRAIMPVDEAVREGMAPAIYPKGGEKAVSVKNVDSMFSTNFPFASDSAFALFHSGSS
jgi:hypothetical protein